MIPQMPYSPLDALLDCLPRVRKSGKVTKTDDVLSVQQRMAGVFLPIVKRIQAEARADEARRCAADVCWACNPNNSWKFGEAARMGVNWWQHQNDRGDIQACLAGTLHERLHRESLTSETVSRAGK